MLEGWSQPGQMQGRAADKLQCRFAATGHISQGSTGQVVCGCAW